MIDCLDIRAVQGDDDPVAYSGPGSIYQDKEGALRLKVFATCNKSHDPIADLRRSNTVTSGTIFSESDLFTVIARATDGHTWTARKVVVNAQRAVLNPDSPIVTAMLSDLRHETRCPKTEEERVALTFRDQEEFEWGGLLGEWEVGAPYTGYRFRVTMRARNHVHVEVRTTASFPEDIVLRLEEAFSFMLGETLRSQTNRLVARGMAVTVLSSSSPAPKQQRRFPPLELRNRSKCASAHELVVRYLQFAATADLPGLWHSCSAHLAHARQAGNNSLDAWTVGVCVALEGISTFFPGEPDDTEKAVVAGIKKTAKQLLVRFDVGQKLQDRVNGLLGQLTHVRVVDRLRPLVDVGAIDKEHLKAWTEARNRGVHTAKLREADFTDPMLQTALLRIFKVQTMLHRLTFRLVGYRGPYVDYARGFETVTPPM